MVSLDPGWIPKISIFEGGTEKLKVVPDDPTIDLRPNFRHKLGALAFNDSGRKIKTRSTRVAWITLSSIYILTLGCPKFNQMIWKAS